MKHRILTWMTCAMLVETAMPGCGSGATLDGGATPTPATTSATLKEAATARGVRIGSYLQHDIRSAAYDDLFKQEFGLMAAGFFWNGGFRPSKNVYDFETFDQDVDFGLKHGMEIHGHTLIWFEEIPDWLKATPNSEVEDIMNDHIDTVVGRYADKIALWDVINEPVDMDGQLRKKHKWYEAMGADYISKAFLRAHKADPKAILRLNEFDMEINEGKFNGVKKLLKDLLDKGVPVHALGWQMHVLPKGTEGTFDPEILLKRMNEIADMGIDNYVSELDVVLPKAATAAYLELQKQTFKSAIKVYLAAKRHKTLVIWGLRDGDPHWFKDNHPLLFDENLKKKPAYDGVREALIEGP